MVQNWLDFLEKNGAKVENGAVEGFDDQRTEARAAVEEDIIADLSHFGVIRAEGEDARDFLQGQFSNDVREVSDGHSQLSTVCSPKGRILAAFRLFRRNDAYWIRLPVEQTTPFLQRLRKYVLMSRVELTDASDEVIRVGVSGPRAPELLGASGLPVPETPDAAAQRDDFTVLRVPGARPRFEIYGELEPMENVWTRLTTEARPVGRGAWALLDIRAGLPNIHERTQEAFVPQMVNMQLIGGVSFQKGCYPGQEVVARMQYLGKLKRRMYLAHVDTGQRPEPGDELCGRVDDSGESIGKVVEAQPAPGGGYDLLAVLQIAAVREGGIRLDSPEGPQLRFDGLPYDTEE